MKGLYIHIPFCSSKCDYCDFYSFTPSGDEADIYLRSLLRHMETWSKKLDGKFDTVYFGGGTPSFFGAERLEQVLKHAEKCFDIDKNAEITVECNPSSTDDRLVYTLAENGVNRLSFGLQSAVTNERRQLGRRSDTERAVHAIELAKKYGITNYSLDLMLAIPNQTMTSLDESLEFIAGSGAAHVSAYMLKIEEGTPLFKRKDSLILPDEDETCDMYLHAVEKLLSFGFEQYEISNFKKGDFYSRHNMKYWNCEEYLGLGPCAHSFLGGRRFYYKRDIKSFIGGEEAIDDGSGGSEEEYIMLRLRLTDGIENCEFEKRYGRKIPQAVFEKAKEFEKSGHAEVTHSFIRLTPKGFLISNYIISELIDRLN